MEQLDVRRLLEFIQFISTEYVLVRIDIEPSVLAFTTDARLKYTKYVSLSIQNSELFIRIISPVCIMWV